MSKSEEDKPEIVMQAESLARLLLSGQASEQDKGIALRTIQIGMASGVVAQVVRLHNRMADAMTLYEELDKAYLDNIQEVIEAGLMTPDEIKHTQTRLYNRILEVLDLERRLLQGKSLFPADTISDEDRKVLRLLGSLQDGEERRRFFKMIDCFFKDRDARQLAASPKKNENHG